VKAFAAGVPPSLRRRATGVPADGTAGVSSSAAFQTPEKRSHIEHIEYLIAGIAFVISQRRVDRRARERPLYEI
jgi:hypothetical protein